MEFRRESLEISIFSETALGLIETALSLSLEVNFGRTKGVALRNEVILIDGL